MFFKKKLKVLISHFILHFFVVIMILLNKKMGEKFRMVEGREYVCSIPVHACTTIRHDWGCWSVGGMGGHSTVNQR